MHIGQGQSAVAFSTKHAEQPNLDADALRARSLQEKNERKSTTRRITGLAPIPHMLTSGAECTKI